MQRILVAINFFNDEHMRRICATADGWAHVERIDHEVELSTYTDALKRCDIVVGWPPADGLVDANLRLVQLCSAGYDPYLGRGLEKKQDCVVCNARGVFSVPAAEQTLAMMFALTRRLNLHIRDQAQHLWKRAPDYRIVDGDTMCVIGLGSIGRAIAERCAGVGMNVVGVTRTGEEAAEPPLSRIVAFDKLAEVLPSAGHVALSVPANSQTIGLFDEAMFRRMKPGSCFYNVARGSLMVEADLINVLNDGHLWGAGLDVFDTEPLPADHPLWGFFNVVVTPHISGPSTPREIGPIFNDNLRRYAANRPLRHLVDRTRGY